MSEPYADYAQAYYEAGFAPIPARGKHAIVRKRHGRESPWVTDAELAKWVVRYPQANIAARLPRDVIAIDVDAYDGKRGGETLDALEAELGTLPETALSTSRAEDDAVSGIRLFRLPEKYWSVLWPGNAGADIQINWMGNRYMIAWPSIHPDTGHEYEWFWEENGEWIPLDGIPDLAQLPEFPEEWAENFARPYSEQVEGDVPDTAAWLKENGSGEMCAQISHVVEQTLENMPGGAHDSARDGIYGIMKDCVAGHTGAWKAASAIMRAFLAEMPSRSVARRREARAEWRRHIEGAIRKAQGSLDSLDGQGIPTVDPCAELEGIADAHPLRQVESICADDVEEREIVWLQKPLLAFGSLAIIDGDPGEGKSLITASAVANATRGLDVLPYGECFGEPINCGMIGGEDDLNSVVVARLRAAGYERSRRVFFMGLKRRKGKLELLTFPHGTERVRSFILQNDLGLLVIDPITSFLGEEVKSFVDASVRAALAPLAEVARDTDCCIVLIRHLNKNGKMQAMYRGGGSIAFSALARSGLITGKLPDGSGMGIAQVKSSHA